MSSLLAGRSTAAQFIGQDCSCFSWITRLRDMATRDADGLTGATEIDPWSYSPATNSYTVPPNPTRRLQRPRDRSPKPEQNQAGERGEDTAPTMLCCRRMVAILPALALLLLAASVSSFVIVPAPPSSRSVSSTSSTSTGGGGLHHHVHEHHVRAKTWRQIEAAAVSGRTAVVLAAAPRGGKGEKEDVGEVEEKGGIEPK